MRFLSYNRIFSVVGGKWRKLDKAKFTVDELEEEAAEIFFREVRNRIVLLGNGRFFNLSTSFALGYTYVFLFHPFRNFTQK